VWWFRSSLHFRDESFKRTSEWRQLRIRDARAREFLIGAIQQKAAGWRALTDQQCCRRRMLISSLPDARKWPSTSSGKLAFISGSFLPIGNVLLVAPMKMRRGKRWPNIVRAALHYLVHRMLRQGKVRRFRPAGLSAFLLTALAAVSEPRPHIASSANAISATGAIPRAIRTARNKRSLSMTEA